MMASAALTVPPDKSMDKSIDKSLDKYMDQSLDKGIDREDLQDDQDSDESTLKGNTNSSFNKSPGNNEKVPPAPLAKSIPTPHVNKQGEVGGAELAEFEVQSPADLLKIARAAGLSYQTVKALNPEVLRWCTPPKEKTYLIKLPVSVTDKFLATYNNQSFPRRVQFMHYKARKGDSLLKVSRRLGIKADLIADLNGLRPKSQLRHGSTIFLPVPNDHSRTLASLDLRDPPESRRRHRRSRRHRYYRVSYKERAAARVIRHRNSEG
jgi:hypothetical protein